MKEKLLNFLASGHTHEMNVTLKKKRDEKDMK